MSEKNTPTSTRYVFLYYAETEAKDGGKILGNRLYRYEMIDDTLMNPKLLLDLPYLPGPSHDGGVLKIGPDKKGLYLVIGNLNFMQNLTYLTKAQNVKDGPAPDGASIFRILNEIKNVETCGNMYRNVATFVNLLWLRS